MLQEFKGWKFFWDTM